MRPDDINNQTPEKRHRRVIVIGGGPAGMMAAGSAAQCGANVTLYEKGAKFGRKLRITGKGRCNITNTAEAKGFIEAFGSNGKFLYGPFSRFFREDLIELLSSSGVECKTERGGRVFPVSNQANDVADALESWLRGLGVNCKMGSSVYGLDVLDGCLVGVRVFGGTVLAGAVVIATGGLSYPLTGSTGDGYQMAAEVSHSITPTTPALSPLITRDRWPIRLQGLTLENVRATLICCPLPNLPMNWRGPSQPHFGESRIEVTSEFGDMLFTHFGISGPIVLTLSRDVPEAMAEGEAALSIDLKPALTQEQLHARLIRDFVGIRRLVTYMRDLLPSKLAIEFPSLCGVDGDKKVNQITAEERSRIVDTIKDLRIAIADMAPIEQAIVTRGGVATTEIDPKTMMSRKLPGLFFAGEVIDIDARTGGFNLQACFSTGYVAGGAAAGWVNGDDLISVIRKSGNEIKHVPECPQ